MALYPLIFHPIFKERIWGGRQLELLYHKPLPPAVSIGESWEISDRPGDVSVIANGPLAGRDLRWLMQNLGHELLGHAPPLAGRFPLLVKLLDAQDRLSLQVHPPASKAAALGGEPKTEMWYIADAAPGAELYVGLKKGVTRAEFERRVQAGTIEGCFHRLKVEPGDAMFLPSGRVHAIGAGLVIFEIQQNSDTTYRVYDWGRAGLDGKPRALHVRESLASIDFNDFEPALCSQAYRAEGSAQQRSLVDDPLFKVEAIRIEQAGKVPIGSTGMKLLGAVEGSLTIAGGGESVQIAKGQFCLIPAEVNPEISAGAATDFLLVRCN